MRWKDPPSLKHWWRLFPLPPAVSLSCLTPTPFIILQNHLAPTRGICCTTSMGVLSSAGEEIRWPGFTACLYTFLSLSIHGVMRGLGKSQCDNV